MNIKINAQRVHVYESQRLLSHPKEDLTITLAQRISDRFQRTP